MASPASVIQLVPASQAFVNNRKNSLGSWVIAGFADCILLGIVLCQVVTFARSQSRRSKEGVAKHYVPLVCIVTVLCLLKTAQAIAIVYIQNVSDFMNPDVARTLVAKAWYQVSAPSVTAVTGVVVQSFFALRFYMLSRNIAFVIPIVAAMLLGLAGVFLSLHNILIGDAKGKVMWLLVHLVSVFATDFLITVGTCWALRKRGDGGLASTSSLVNRLLRLVFEAAIPPTLVAAADLIMTQVLDLNHLLWHLLLNFMLQKLYVISLMYTLNSISEYARQTSSGGRPSGFRTNASRRTDLELQSPVSAKGRMGFGDVIVSTQTITHTSPGTGTQQESEHELESKSGWQPDWSRP